VGRHPRAAVRAADRVRGGRAGRGTTRWANVYEGEFASWSNEVEVWRVIRRRQTGSGRKVSTTIDSPRATVARRLRAADGRYRQGRERVIANDNAESRDREKSRTNGSLTSSAPEFLAACNHDRDRQRRPGGGTITSAIPRPRLLDRYRAIGAEISKDQDGAVMVDKDGYSVHVRTFTVQALVVH